LAYVFENANTVCDPRTKQDIDRFDHSALHSPREKGIECKVIDKYTLSGKTEDGTLWQQKFGPSLAAKGRKGGSLWRGN
jgi:hypothetical protein